MYDYLHKLEQAGLITRVGDDAGTVVYPAEEFELTLTVRETEVSITPEIIEVIAQKNEYQRSNGFSKTTESSHSRSHTTS